MRSANPLLSLLIRAPDPLDLQLHIELHKIGMSQPSLNVATFHPTIQTKPLKKYNSLPRDDRDHLEIPPA